MKSTDQDALNTAETNAAHVARSRARCTHGDRHVTREAKIRVLGLECTCSFAIRTFSQASRFIGRLDPQWFKKLYDED